MKKRIAVFTAGLVLAGTLCYAGNGNMVCHTNDYASNPNMTSLRGSMTLNNGTVIIQNFQVLE